MTRYLLATLIESTPNPSKYSLYRPKINGDGRRGGRDSTRRTRSACSVEFDEGWEEGDVLKSGVLSTSRGNASVEARIPARIGTRALRTPDSMDVRAYASEIKRL